MKLFFLLLFIAVPLIELGLLIKVGEVIGILPTIALVIGTAVVGVSLLKRQGLAALGKARETVEAGELPVESVIDGACLLVAGAFLLTPGLLTDTAGFLLLVPALRRGIAHWLFGKILSSGNVHVSTFGGGPPGDRPGPSRDGNGDAVIEGEFKELDEPQEPSQDKRQRGNGPSPWRR